MNTIKAKQGYVLCNGTTYSADNIVLGVNDSADNWQEMTIEQAKSITEAGIEAVVVNYEEEVERLIRQRYTVSEELAIQRQRFDKPEEFDVYNNYCEECKNQVKEYLNETQG